MLPRKEQAGFCLVTAKSKHQLGTVLQNPRSELRNYLRHLSQVELAELRMMLIKGRHRSRYEAHSWRIETLRGINDPAEKTVDFIVNEQQKGQYLWCAMTAVQQASAW